MLADNKLNRTNYIDTDVCEEGNINFKPTDKISGQEDQRIADKTLHIFRKGLNKTLDTFHEMKKEVYIVNDVPRINLNAHELFVKDLLKRYFNFKTNVKTASDLEQYYESAKTVLNMFHRANKYYDIKFLNPYKALCPDVGVCKVIDDMGFPIYVDNNHLSLHGDLYLAAQMKSEFVKALSISEETKTNKIAHN